MIFHSFIIKFGSKSKLEPVSTIYKVWGGQVKRSLQTIAAYLCLHWGILNKLQGKMATQSEKFEWWIILMVVCASTAGAPEVVSVSQ